MNERIRQLAEECGLLYKLSGPSVETRYTKKKEETLTAFADLIVRECLLKIENERYELPDFIIDNVKQHFGVTE